MSNELRATLDGLKNLGHREAPFHALGGQLQGVMRTIQPQELSLVMEWASSMEGAEALMRHRTGILAVSIVELNGVDLRGMVVDMEITDPPTKEGGAPVVHVDRVPVSRYLRDVVIPSWSSDVVQAVLIQYQTMNKKAELEAMKGVEFDDESLDEAIVDAKKRLDRLEAMKKARKGSEEVVPEAATKE